MSVSFSAGPSSVDRSFCQKFLKRQEIYTIESPILPEYLLINILINIPSPVYFKNWMNIVCVKIKIISFQACFLQPHVKYSITDWSAQLLPRNVILKRTICWLQQMMTNLDIIGNWLSCRCRYVCTHAWICTFRFNRYY